MNECCCHWGAAIGKRYGIPSDELPEFICADCPKHGEFETEHRCKHHSQLVAMFDSRARRMGEIMGDGLRTQVINSQYHVDHGNKSADDLGHRLLLRALELRDAEQGSDHA